MIYVCMIYFGIWYIIYALCTYLCIVHCENISVDMWYVYNERSLKIFEGIHSKKEFTTKEPWKPQTCSVSVFLSRRIFRFYMVLQKDNRKSVEPSEFVGSHGASFVFCRAWCFFRPSDFRIFQVLAWCCSECRANWTSPLKGRHEVTEVTQPNRSRFFSKRFENIKIIKSNCKGWVFVLAFVNSVIVVLCYPVCNVIVKLYCISLYFTTLDFSLWYPILPFYITWYHLIPDIILNDNITLHCIQWYYILL